MGDHRGGRSTPPRDRQHPGGGMHAADILGAGLERTRTIASPSRGEPRGLGGEDDTTGGGAGAGGEAGAGRHRGGGGVDLGMQALDQVARPDAQQRLLARDRAAMARSTAMRTEARALRRGGGVDDREGAIFDRDSR